MSTREAAMLAIVVLGTIAVYLPSLRNGWVSDDLTILVWNKSIGTWSFITNAFTRDVLWSVKLFNPNNQIHSASYRPLELVWFALNAHLFGVNHPALWHAMKIVLHVIAVLLCFRIAQLLTGEAAIALLAAAIFGIMPAQVEPVVWASAVPEPLSTVFMLAALVFLIERKPGWSRGLLLSAFFYALAILTHEIAVFFPLIVFSYLMIFEREAGEDRRSRAVPEGRSYQQIGRALTACIPFLFVTLIYAFARIHALGDHAFGMPRAYAQLRVPGSAGPQQVHGLAPVVMTFPMVSLLYLGILALPGLADPWHSIEWTTHLDSNVIVAWGALLALAAAGIVLASRSSNRKLYLFCAIWSLVTIAPALRIDKVVWLNQDRYLYGPSFGWSVALALAIIEISAIGARTRVAVGIATALLLLGYGFSNVRTQRYFHDDVAYYTRIVEIKPHDADFRLALADRLEGAKDAPAAARQLEIAEAINPAAPMFHIRLAQIYMKLGRVQDFQREYDAYEASGASVIKTVHRDPSAAAQSAPAPSAPH